MRPRATILVKLLVALVLPALDAVHAVRVRRVRGEPARSRRRARAPARGDRRVGGHPDPRQVPRSSSSPATRASAPTRTTSTSSRRFAQATGAQLYVFDRGLRQRAPTPRPTSRSARHYFRAELDRAELARVFDHGETASSVTFDGNDGKTYKAGYAPVRAELETDAPIVLALGAQAPASYFARLADLRDRLFLWGAGLAAGQHRRGGARDAADHAQRAPARRGRRADRRRRSARAGRGSRSRDELGVLGADDGSHARPARRARRAHAADARRHRARGPQPARRHDAVRRHPAGRAARGRRAPRPRRSDPQRARLPRARRQRLPRVRAAAAARARRRRRSTSCCAEVAQLASDRATSTIADRGPAGSRARADRGQLRRALLNLARNAVQAAAAAGHRGGDAVRMSARARDGELAIDGVEPRQGDLAGDQRASCSSRSTPRARRAPASASRSCARSPSTTAAGSSVDSADGETTFTIVLPRAYVLRCHLPHGDDPHHRRQRDDPRGPRAHWSRSSATRR